MQRSFDHEQIGTRMDKKKKKEHQKAYGRSGMKMVIKKDKATIRIRPQQVSMYYGTQMEIRDR